MTDEHKNDKNELVENKSVVEPVNDENALVNDVPVKIEPDKNDENEPVDNDETGEDFDQNNYIYKEVTNPAYKLTNCNDDSKTCEDVKEYKIFMRFPKKKLSVANRFNNLKNKVTSLNLPSFRRNEKKGGTKKKQETSQ